MRDAQLDVLSHAFDFGFVLRQADTEYFMWLAP